MAAWLMGSVLLAACTEPESASTYETSGAEQPDQAQDGVADAAPERPDLKYHMDVSFWAAIDARDSLINGNLTKVRGFGNALATQDFSYLPDQWQPWVKRMQQKAADVEVAPDLNAAAQSVSDLAVTCGNCHWATDAGPHRQPFDRAGAVPGEPEELDERMYRHQWAANELWMALITPSFKAWSRGAMALRRAPVDPPTQDGEAIDPAMQTRLEEIRNIGTRAVSASSVEDRSRMYAELLAKCAHCHQQVSR